MARKTSTESATDRATRKNAESAAKAEAKQRKTRAAGITRAADAGQAWEDGDRASDRSSSGWRVWNW
ncbi:hypothetical protein ACFY0G_02105 [Streptomyces sp. NPDC001552]|uniref:hypothetical protein n=1 Tax=Streptomyces sp. NPDC001552 TaxID=3364587 RepID=UPI0036B14FB4